MAMSFVRQNKQKLLLVAIVILAAFLILFHLDRADMQHDDAHYSLRAIGYLDEMDSKRQTTPVRWFETIPWWSKLSFHDHPPLVFLIQHLFFNFFGVSVVVARLPAALAGIGSILLLYYLAKELYNEKVALLATFLLVISTLQIWISKISYLESLSLFFLLLTYLFFFKGLKDPKKFIFFGLSLGLAMLTKYVTFFVWPVVFGYLLLKDRKILVNKYFILSILIAILVFSPVIFYNFKLWQTRGHFDLQFTLLFNQDKSDWPVISRGGASTNLIEQSVEVWRQLADLYSRPFYLIIVISVIYLLLNLVLKPKQNQDLFLILNLFFLQIQLALIGPSSHFLALFTPFLALALALSLGRFYQIFAATDNQKLRSLEKIGYFLVVIIILGFEFFYNLNTNLFYQPIGQKGRHYSASRWENGGFQQLEDYLAKENDFKNLKMISIYGKKDLIINLGKDLGGKNFIIYDTNLNWFSVLWYLRQWSIYYHYPFISLYELYQVIPDTDWTVFFQERGIKFLYFIEGQKGTLFGDNFIPEQQQLGKKLINIFKTYDAETIEIKNINNQLAFKVYKLKLNN